MFYFTQCYIKHFYYKFQSLKWFKTYFFEKMPYQTSHHIDLLMYNGKLDQPIT